MQCWSNRDEAPELIVRLNIDSESTSADSEGHLRSSRPISVAQGMDIVLGAEALGDVSDDKIDVILMQDDIVLGEVKAEKNAETSLFAGTIQAQGVRENAIIAIECVRHDLGN